ncbi:UvrABC system protein C, partial [Dissostichus eleginoides]
MELLFTLRTGTDVSSRARPRPGNTANRDRVMAPAVKMVTELPVEWLLSCDGYSCNGQGLPFIPTKVISTGYPALCRYRVDCKHRYE